MSKRSIIRKTLTTVILSASLLGAGAGVAQAKPIEHTVGGNCRDAGGQWSSVWAEGSYIGGTCTWSNYRAHFDSDGINYLSERKIKGKWVRDD